MRSSNLPLSPDNNNIAKALLKELIGMPRWACPWPVRDFLMVMTRTNSCVTLLESQVTYIQQIRHLLYDHSVAIDLTTNRIFFAIFQLLLTSPVEVPAQGWPWISFFTKFLTKPGHLPRRSCFFSLMVTITLEATLLLMQIT